MEDLARATCRRIRTTRRSLARRTGAIHATRRRFARGKRHAVHGNRRPHFRKLPRGSFARKPRGARGRSPRGWRSLHGSVREPRAAHPLLSGDVPAEGSAHAGRGPQCRGRPARCISRFHLGDLLGRRQRQRARRPDGGHRRTYSERGGYTRCRAFHLRERHGIIGGDGSGSPARGRG